MNKYIHVKTQEECDAVLKKIELDYPNVRWADMNEKPTEYRNFFFGHQNVLRVIDKELDLIIDGDKTNTISAQEYLGEEEKKRKKKLWKRLNNPVWYPPIESEYKKFKQEPTEEDSDVSETLKSLKGFKDCSCFTADQKPTEEEEKYLVDNSPATKGPLKEPKSECPNYCSNCGHKIK